MNAGCCTHTCREGRDCPERQPRRVPFNTGKVAIGIAYTPRPLPLTADQERMQAALLNPRTAHPMTTLQRLAGAIWRWL